MSEYQLYLFNHPDHLSPSERFRSFNDLCAKLFAEKCAEAGPMELWSGALNAENWHEERDRLLKLIKGIESGAVTHIDEDGERQLQPTSTRISRT